MHQAAFRTICGLAAGTTLFLAGCGTAQTITVTATPSSVVAQSGNPSPSPTQPAAPAQVSSSLTFSGDEAGSLSSLSIQCGTKRADAIVVDGNLGGTAYEIAVIPTLGPGDQAHVEISQGDTGSLWAGDLGGVTNLKVHTGFDIDETFSTYAGPGQGLHVSGHIVC